MIYVSFLFLFYKKYSMKIICMAVMLFITLLPAGAQKNIPASDKSYTFHGREGQQPWWLFMELQS